MTQREHIKKLAELIDEYPDHSIFHAVDTEVLNDQFGWMMHEIGRIEVGGWWFDGGEHIYTDPDNVADKLSEILGRDVSEEEAAEKMTPAIIVYTHPGGPSQRKPS